MDISSAKTYTYLYFTNHLIFFPLQCIENWLDRNETCPLCRAPVGISQLKSVESLRKDFRRRQQEDLVKNEESNSNLSYFDRFFSYKTEDEEMVSLKSTKTKAVLKLLLEIRQKDPKQKTIVFSQFTMFLDMLEIILDNALINFVRLDGSMSSQERSSAIDAFCKHETVTVFLMSLKAGGCGLNLTPAKNVIICDPWWNVSCFLFENINFFFF